MSWLFPDDRPLPEGCSLEALQPAADELGDARLALAEELLGREAARSVARRLGHYELTEALALRLELEGVKLGEAGEVRALSPARWGRFPEARSWAGLRETLAESRAVLEGLQLSPEQAGGFRRFLSRHSVGGSAPVERVVELARHYFHGQPINVVVRYTATVRADS